VKQGANKDLGESNKGSTALIVAAINSHQEITEFLVKEGAQINKVDNDGSIPMLGGVRCACKLAHPFFAWVGDPCSCSDNGSTQVASIILLLKSAKIANQHPLFRFYAQLSMAYAYLKPAQAIAGCESLPALLTPLLSRNPVSPPQQPLLAQMNAPTVYGPAYLRVPSEAVTMLPCYASELRC
jgi:hypothetical protein